MADKLSIINEARVAAGESVVSDLTPIDDMMSACLAVYDSIVAKEMSVTQWRFNTVISTPVFNLTRDDRILPYNWLLPDGLINLISVRYFDFPLKGDDFEILNNAVYTRFPDNITLEYQYVGSEETWVPTFVSIIARRLTSICFRATERHAEARAYDAETDRQLAFARNADARQRRERSVGDGSIVARRRGNCGYPGSYANTVTGGGGSGSTTTPAYRAMVSSMPLQPGDGIIEATSDCPPNSVLTFFPAGAIRELTFINSSGAQQQISDGTNIVAAPLNGDIVRLISNGTNIRVG